MSKEKINLNEEKIEENLPPKFIHHETARKRLREKVTDEKLTEEEASQIYDEWLKRRKGK